MLKNVFFSGLAAHKRFYFLKTIEAGLYEIHKDYASALRGGNVHFYHFWVKMIDDTRRFIKIGLDVLEYQRKCPAHLLVDEEKTRTFPICQWTAQRSDLMEAIVGLYHADIIRMQDGSRPSFMVFAKEIGNVFGVTFNYPHDEMRKIINRKKKSNAVFEPSYFRHERKN